MCIRDSQHVVGVLLFKLHAQHQAPAPDVLHLGHGLQLFPEVGALLQHALEEIRLRHPAHHYPGGGAGNGVAPKGGAVLAGLQDVPQPFADQAGAHGKAPGNALGAGDHIRLDAVPLVGEEAPRAADAGLHLVNEEEDILLPAQLGQALYKALVLSLIHI